MTTGSVRSSRTSTSITTLCYSLLIVISATYYLILITNGELDPLRPTDFGMTFNSMLEHLVRGEFDVDPKAIESEGFLRNGKTYSYFGVVPALLRLPLLAIDSLSRYDLTRLYCVLAATLGLCFKLASAALINGQLPKSRLQAITFTVLVLSLVFGGAQVQFLKSSIYQETIDWAGVVAAAFVYCSLRGLVRGFSTRLIAVMATLAGVELLTRVSTAIGLYLALVLLLIALAWSEASPISNGVSRFARALIRGRTVAALAILFGFAILCGVVNFERWGNPLVFADFHIQLVFVRMGRVPRLAAYGEFNIERLWYGVLYYFFPIWTIITPNGHFLFADFELRMLDAVELPPSSFLASDPLLLVLGATFFLRLSQVRKERLVDIRAVAALMTGFSTPMFLMLTAIFMAFRYRMEFYPFIEFTAYLGFYAMCVNPNQYSVASRRWLYILLIASAALGIVCSHLLFILYRLSQFSDYKRREIMGENPTGVVAWVRYYWLGLKTMLPGIAAKLPF